jgi:phosphate transport system protein
VDQLQPPHTSRDFETELRELRAHALAMGARCERAVRLAFQAYWDGEFPVADEVGEVDAQIDQDEVDIHTLVLRILALRQPVAKDLRFLASALRLITDLERVGDEAVNITERIVGGDDEAKLSVQDLLPAMSDDAQDMLRVTLQAFVDGDADAAASVLTRDDAVDKRCAEVMRMMIGHISSHPLAAAAGLRVIRTAKHLERIADHATNVAEEVIFMVRGDDVRHARGGRSERPHR